jgi:hypothetical protein
LDGPPRLFSASTLCPTCPLAATCGAALTDKACPDTWSANDPGGRTVSHPQKPGTMEELLALGGPEFDDIVAREARLPRLPLYTPQPRYRTSLRGVLAEDIYAMRARDVVKKKRVVSANELREVLGLRSTQLIALLLFDRDEILEDMWERGGLLIWELAEAGYDLIVSPSFSTYSPRPRTEFLINTRRSMLYFQALQEAGAPAVARVAWEVTRDAHRFAKWVAANPSVELVALDWSPYRWARDWQDQLDGLSIFDALTDQHLSYFVNGLTTPRRCDALFRVVPPERVRITNATTQARLPPPSLRAPGDRTGATFAARCEIRRSVVDGAADRAMQNRVCRSTTRRRAA